MIFIERAVILSYHVTLLREIFRTKEIRKTIQEWSKESDQTNEAFIFQRRTVKQIDRILYNCHQYRASREGFRSDRKRIPIQWRTATSPGFFDTKHLSTDYPLHFFCGAACTRIHPFSLSYVLYLARAVWPKYQEHVSLARSVLPRDITPSMKHPLLRRGWTAWSTAYQNIRLQGEREGRRATENPARRKEIFFRGTIPDPSCISRRTEIRNAKIIPPNKSDGNKN